MGGWGGGGGQIRPQAVLFGCWMSGEWDLLGGGYNTDQSRSNLVEPGLVCMV